MTYLTERITCDSTLGQHLLCRLERTLETDDMRLANVSSERHLRRYRPSMLSQVSLLVLHPVRHPHWSTACSLKLTATSRSANARSRVFC